MVVNAVEFAAQRAALDRLARRLLGRTHAGRVDLSGVVQQTLVEAATAGPPAGEGGSRWLRTLLRRNLLDTLRHVRAARRDVRREQPHAGDPFCRADSPSRTAIRAERVQAVAAALDRLPADQREAVRLRYLDDLGLDDIAGRMGKSRAAVAGLLRRGLADLRAAVSPD